MNEYLETLRELLRYYESRNNGSADSQAKVNALRWAVAELEAREPTVKHSLTVPPNTIRVRFAAAVDVKGNWTASGDIANSEERNREDALACLSSTADPVQVQMVEADLIRPAVPTVQGRVVE